jgi:hypothetical protein
MSTSDAVHTLARDLQEILGGRLKSVIVYGPSGAVTYTLAIVDGLAKDDLDACAAKMSEWHDAHLATPLLLATHEFENALDAFPLEFGAILANYKIVSGANPFVGLAVDPADLRRACEVQARSHLLHLRQGYLETRGQTDALAALIVRSAAPFKALLHSIERLEGSAPHLSDGIVHDVTRLADVTELSHDQALRIFPAYLAAVERLVTYVDRWGT